MATPPSVKQIEFLKRLGYKGQVPLTLRQASVAIDAMRSGKDSVAAEKAIRAQIKIESDRDKKNRKDQIKQVQEEIRFMVKENREYGGRGLYAGFRLVALEDELPSPEDAPLVGSFVSLEEAQKNPSLIVRETLEYEEVMADEAPGPGGKPTPRKGCTGCFVLLVLLGGCAYFLSSVPKPAVIPAHPPAREEVRRDPVELMPPESQPLKSPSPPESEAIATPITEEPPESLMEVPATPALPVPDPDEVELNRWAASQLNLAKQYLKIKKTAKAVEIIDQLIERAPHSPAAGDARQTRARLSP